VNQKKRYLAFRNEIYFESRQRNISSCDQNISSCYPNISSYDKISRVATDIYLERGGINIFCRVGLRGASGPMPDGVRSLSDVFSGALAGTAVSCWSSSRVRITAPVFGVVWVRINSGFHRTLPALLCCDLAPPSFSRLTSYAPPSS
jgi:hypothetical protein